MDTDNTQPESAPLPDGEVHQKIGALSRQLHDALKELGYADQLRGTMGELPDAQSRLSYIARLTGEAAEKVLTRVEHVGQCGADGLLADAGDDLAHDTHVDVGFEQSGADLAEHLVDVGLGETALAAQALGDALQSVAQ